MSEYKRYYWNRNAATHRDALTRFAWIAGLAAMMLAIFISIAFLPVERTAETYRAAAIVTVVSLIVVWVVVFGLLTWAYWALNEGQFQVYSTDEKTPPPQGGVSISRFVPVYHNGKEAGYFQGEGDHENK